MCRASPILSHFLFADDCFHFYMITDGETTSLSNILDTYGRASGQIINIQKSEVFFSYNTSNDMIHKIMYALEVIKIIGIGKYLGLTSLIGWKKKISFWLSKGYTLEENQSLVK